MKLPILIVCGYVVIAVIIYLIASFIDGRRLGKGEITQKDAENEVGNNAMVATLWPIIVLGLIIYSPIALICFMGEGVRKLGESTTLQNDTKPNSDDLSGGCTCN